MSFVVQSSPGVAVREIDLTTVVQASAATDGAFAGRFNWGPVLEPVLVSDEERMVARFGQPVTLKESQDFLVAASFLAYTNALRLVRVGDTAVMRAAGDDSGVAVWNDDSYDSYIAGAGLTNSFIGKYPGEFGNSIEVHTCISAAQYSTAHTATDNFTVTKGSKSVTVNTPADLDFTTVISVDDFVEIAGVKYLVAAVTADTLTLDRAYVGTTNAALTSITSFWKFSNLFGAAPATNEAHIVEVDADGVFTGVEGTVLKAYANVSLNDSTAKYDDGTSKYYATAINRQSQHIRWGGADLATTGAGSLAGVFELAGGLDDNENAGNDEFIDAYNLFSNAEEIDASLIITGAQGATIANFITDNICDVRRDCMNFIGPEQADVVNNAGNEIADIKAYRNTLTSSSYAFFVDNWKYMYDKYNDTYRWVPVTGDIAGLVARTEVDRAAWFSPAGFNRGIIKNVVKLAWSADKTSRDELYPLGINSVVNFNGVGKVLYGDATLNADQSSAFAQINVRRLFIVLEKAIANASRLSLFEFNDEFTRAAFVSIVEPFLREVQGDRGITDFEVVCDERNNTPQVIDTRNFVGDIYLKPARSINYITLNFVAVGTGVAFEEVIGRAA